MLDSCAVEDTWSVPERGPDGRRRPAIFYTKPQLVFGTIDMDAVAIFRSVLAQRVSEYPENVYYRVGKDQLAIIDQDIARNGRLSQATYARLTLGVMCAREVEQIDMPFCDAAYAMLEAIKPKA